MTIPLEKHKTTYTIISTALVARVQQHGNAVGPKLNASCFCSVKQRVHRTGQGNLLRLWREIEKDKNLFAFAHSSVYLNSFGHRAESRVDGALFRHRLCNCFHELVIQHCPEISDAAFSVWPSEARRLPIEPSVPSTVT